MNENFIKDFCDTFSVSPEEIKNALKDFSISCYVNGEPVFDFKGNKEEEPKPEEPVVEETTVYEPPTCEVEEDTSYGPNERFTDIIDTVSKDDFDETYWLAQYVKGNEICERQCISFDYTASDGITTPGIKDEDVLKVLLYRNQNNKVRFDALVDVLKTY